MWNAYSALDRDRHHSMAGPGPIPFSSIDAYARRYGIEDAGEFERFMRMIMTLDGVYLKHVDKVTKDRSDKAKRQAS